MTEEYSKKYFDWLCSDVGVNKGDTTYFHLAKRMFEIPFYAIVQDDENRISDGLLLRKEFTSSLGYVIREEDDSDTKVCNFLELTIGLSKRLDYLADSDGDDDNHVRWFWEIISNAGLDIYDDKAYFNLNGIGNVWSVLDSIAGRRYSSDGKGGFFPIIGTEKGLKDYRKEPLRIQMWDYIKSHYI